MILKKEEMTKAIKEVKDEINSLLTKESSKEELENISKISQKIDSLNDQIGEVYGENAELKESLIKYIKTGGDNKPPQDESREGETKSLECIIDEISKNKN